MKLNRSSTGLLLLVLISFNIIISNCEQIKNKRGKKVRSSYTRNKLTRYYSESRTKNFILEKLEKELTDPENIIYFTLGVASEFSSDVEPLYREVKKIVDAFSPCFDVMKEAYKYVKGLGESDTLKELRKSEAIKLLEETLSKKENQKEYCLKTKEEISNNFMKATWESEPNRGGLYSDVVKFTPDFLLSMSYNIAKNVVTKDEFCFRPINTRLAPKISQELRQKFSSLDVYYQQCIYFNNLDCDIFAPETSGVWAFIKKSYRYFDLVKKTGTCISNLVNKPSADKRLEKVKAVGDLYKEGGFFYKALATTLGVVANVLTFGAWGGIKGGYYLIELGLQIKEFYDKVTEDLSFKIGKIVGKGIAIAQNLLIGRRKFFRRIK